MILKLRKRPRPRSPHKKPWPIADTIKFIKILLVNYL
jgi:hypothetical protein